MSEEKSFEVRVSNYILSRTVKAKTLEEAKRIVKDKVLEVSGGYSVSLIFECREIKWLHEKYPKDIGFEPVTDWK